MERMHTGSIEDRSPSPLPQEDDDIARMLDAVENIPWSFVPRGVNQALALKLDQYSTDNKDWRGLAETLNYGPDFIKTVPTRKAAEHNHSCTQYFLEEYAKEEDSSVLEVRGILIQLENFPCVKILDGHIKEIIDRFKQHKERSNQRRRRSIRNKGRRDSIASSVQDPSIGSSIMETKDIDPSPAQPRYLPVLPMPTNLDYRSHVRSGFSYPTETIPRKSDEVSLISPDDSVSLAGQYDRGSEKRLEAPLTGNLDTASQMEIDEYRPDLPTTIMLREKYPNGHDEQSAYNVVGAELVIPFKEKPSPSNGPRHARKSNIDHKRKIPSNPEQARKVPRDEYNSLDQSILPMDLSTKKTTPKEKVESWLASTSRVEVQLESPRVVPERLPYQPTSGFTAINESQGSPIVKLKMEDDKVLYSCGSAERSTSGSQSGQELQMSLRETSLDTTGGSMVFNSAGVSNSTVSMGQYSKAETAKVQEVSMESLVSQMNGQMHFNTVPRVKNSKAEQKQCWSLDREDPKNRSYPNNAKPGPHRKAEREKTAFVTYSADNDSHVKNVFSLAKNLHKNGFGVAIDEKNREFLVPQSEKKEVTKLRYQKANYIVVCISPQYRADLDHLQRAGEEETEFENRKGKFTLHTKFIHNLMYLDLTQRIRSHRQFVIVLMSGGSHTDIPHWLRNSPIYHWPREYKDFLYYLTDPEESLNKCIHNHSSSKTHYSV